MQIQAISSIKHLGVADSMSMTTQGITSFGTTRQCVNCGEEFQTTNVRQKKCRKSCRASASRNGARTLRREINDRQFIGVDGEGVTRPTGEHIYDMLSVGTKTLVSDNGAQLDYKEIFTFLYANYLANPDACYVGFFLGYDFSQWFRTLPENRARMLLSPEGRLARKRKNHDYLGPFPVDDGEWEFDILGMKRFKLRPIGAKGWMYINDAGPYFQTSFLNVINPINWDHPIVDDDEYALIVQGKSDRGRPMELAEQLECRAETQRYNTLENQVLARVMSRLNAGFTRVGVKLAKDQWYGPGQAAQQWMGTIGVPNNKEAQDVIPDFAWDAAQASYFGGWFEIFAHGTIPGTTYEYDINSAYPYIISRLPCLLHGKWTHDTGSPRDWEQEPYLLVQATVSGTNPIVGTMLHRSSKHRILRPHHTKGWYWAHELAAAIRAGIVDTVEIEKYIRYQPCDCPGPYETEMPKLYTERLRAGKNSPEGKAYKLLYNSAYGKHAQSIGNPRFANSVYASLITAGCRTMILDAIATHPTGTESLLMVATDGVYFRKPHPTLDISPSELGRWDYAPKENLTLFMPGLYWDDTTRERILKGESPKLKSRGISAQDLVSRIQDLDSQFDAMKGTGEWPGMQIPIRFQMVSGTQALARHDWNTAGTVVRDPIKIISSNPHTKRIDDPYLIDDIIRTPVYDVADTLESVPYNKTFGKTDNEDELGISPDGNLSKLFYEMVTPE